METVRPNTKIMTLDEERNQWKTWDVFPGRYSDASPDSEHMEILVAALSKKGAAYWNDWRAAHPSGTAEPGRNRVCCGGTPFEVPLESICLAMTSAAMMNLLQLLPSRTLTRRNYKKQSFANHSSTKAPSSSRTSRGADLTQASMSVLKRLATNFSRADLSRALLHASTVFACNFDEADLEGASLDGALLNGSSLRKARLRSTMCGVSDLTGCKLNGADPFGRPLPQDEAWWC